jgi:hypothetical protein
MRLETEVLNGDRQWADFYRRHPNIPFWDQFPGWRTRLQAILDEDNENIPRRVNIIMRHVDYSKALKKRTQASEDIYEYAYIDSGSDTCGIGGEAWIIDTITERKVQVTGYDTLNTVKEDVPIVSAITAIDLPTGETILMRVNEATNLGRDAYTLLSPMHIRENDVYIDDKPKRHGGNSCMVVDDAVIPLSD